MSAVGCVLARLLQQAWLWSAYWRLYPLWNLLRQAVPEIELPPEPGMRWNIRYRLHLRVIEIRDAQLVLRPYSVTAIARMAAAIAEESGLPPDRAAAVTEAAIIISALRFRSCGSVCRHNRIPADHVGPGTWQRHPCRGSQAHPGVPRHPPVLYRAARRRPPAKPGYVSFVSGISPSSWSASGASRTRR
jgi:Family of unknown function (DUF6545)